jgi:hypothetical protein
MQKIISAFCFALSLTGAAASASTALTADQSRKIIGAFRTVGFLGTTDKSSGNVTFQKNIACQAAWNTALDASNRGYALASYTCDLGAAKFAGPKAQVLFDAVDAAMGDDSGMGKTWTEAKNLQCSIELKESDVAKRFACTHD